MVDGGGIGTGGQVGERRQSTSACNLRDLPDRPTSICCPCKADIACGGGNGSNKFWKHGTLAASETNACRFGTQIPMQVLLERSMQGSAMEEKYRDFLRAFWRLSEQDGYPVVLREFEQVISLIQGNARMTQNDLNRPFSILSVDWEGNFSTFDPELLSVASDRYGSFKQTCHKSCEYFGLCGGGNGSNKFWEHGTLAAKLEQVAPSS